MKKTTAQLTYRIKFYMYSEPLEYSSLYFTGTNSDKLNKALEKYMKPKHEKWKKWWQDSLNKEINKLKEELKTVKDGWFSKPRTLLQKRIENFEMNMIKQMPDIMKYKYYSEFLSKYKTALISSSDGTLIYQILWKSSKQ